MAPPKLSSVAVVTVTYNSSTIIADFLTSVKVSEIKPPLVYVVDNDSADWRETGAVAEALGAIFLRLDENRGYGGGMNAAIAALSSEIDYVLIANPDLTIGRSTIRLLLEAFADTPRCAAAGPLIVNPDGSVYPSARNQPSLRTGLGHALFSGVWPGNPWSRIYRQELPSLEPSQRTVGWLSGACLLVDRAAFVEVGGFDETFFMYFEDVDLGRRFLDNGYANLYVPGATIMHLGAHSTRTASVRMIAAHHKSAYLFLSRRYAGAAHAPLRLALRAALRVRAWWLTHHP